MNQDKGVVRIAVIVLIIALVVIYSLANANRKTAEQTNQQPITQIFNTTTKNQPQENIPATVVRKNTPTQNTEKLYNTKPTDAQEYDSNGGIVQGRGITKISNESLNNREDTTQKTTSDLPGTTLHIGGLASLQTLGIDPVYILKDQQEAIYYIPLDQQYDRGTIASRYNGSIKELLAQTEIQSNELWGDKITYINLPQYAGQLVLMVVETNKKERLLQIDYASYHTNKEHMKQRFY